MKLTTILFDLDGTLLPMDQEQFVHCYFGLLCRSMAPHGYKANQLVDAIWSSTAAMVVNDGSQTNEAVFWQTFAAQCGEQVLENKPLFDAFYQTEFQNARSSCGFTPHAAETLRRVKAMGLQAVLATNPIFPAAATESRVRWAGLQPEDFCWITTYECAGFCKPNPDYYREILTRLNLRPEECLMVGNDVTEDLVAETLGMRVFLLTDCLINKTQQDLSRYPQGSFLQLWAYLEQETAR